MDVQPARTSTTGGRRATGRGAVRRGATGRGAVRREAIVRAAAELFAERGYPGVGMDEIGAAAGVTGPAIYRHFDSKSAVLAAVIEGIIDAVDAPVGGDGPASRGGDGASGDRASRADANAGGGGDGVASRDRDGAGAMPADRLAALVVRYAAAVAQRRELMAVFVREVHHLPAEHAERLRHRQRDLVARWRALLAAAHPGWPGEQVRTSVHAVFGMLNAVGTFASPLSDAELADQLVGLASAALDLAASSSADSNLRSPNSSTTSNPSRR